MLNKLTNVKNVQRKNKINYKIIFNISRTKCLRKDLKRDQARQHCPDIQTNYERCRFQAGTAAGRTQMQSETCPDQQHSCARTRADATVGPAR